MILRFKKRERGKCYRYLSRLRDKFHLHAFPSTKTVPISNNPIQVPNYSRSDTIFSLSKEMAILSYPKIEYSCFHFRDSAHSKFQFLRWFSINDVMSLIKITWADFSRLHHSSSIFRTKWCQSWPYKTQKRIASSH